MSENRIEAVTNISRVIILTVEESLKDSTKQYSPSDIESMANAVKVSLENLAYIEALEEDKGATDEASN